MQLRDGETTIKIEFALLRAGGLGGREENPKKTLLFFFSRGKRHDNKILKLQMLLSRNFVVIAQAPSNVKITSQKVSWTYSWALIGDLNDFGTVISGDLGLWEK